MPKISIIVPVYNTEEFLRQALLSLQRQSLEDLEFVCVNDGSTDKSLSIIEEYASTDTRFVVVDKPNGGYGHAMNAGIEKASGDYIGILEPDDFVDVQMFELLYQAAEQFEHVDIVRGSFYYFDDAKEDGTPALALPAETLRRRPKTTTYYDSVEDAPWLLSGHPSIWACIYRRSFLAEENIRFIEPPGAGWADNPFLYETTILSKGTVWLPRPLYYYRRFNEKSSSHLTNIDVPLDRLDDIIDVFERREVESRAVWERFSLRAFNYIMSILNGMPLNEQTPRAYERIAQVMSRMDKDVVLQSSSVNADRKALFRELTGIKRQNIARHERVDSPSITVVVPLHNKCRYVYECLRAFQMQTFEDFELFVVDVGGSRDITEDFVGHFTERDKRINYYTGSLPALASSISSPFVYICNWKSKIRKRALHNTLNDVQAGAADLYIFAAGKNRKWPRGVVGSSDAAEGFYSSTDGRCNDVCTDANLFKDSIKSFDGNFYAFGGMEFAPHLIAKARRVVFSDVKHYTNISRGTDVPSIELKAEVPPLDSLRTGSLLKIKSYLKKEDMYARAFPAFRHYAAKGIVKDLESQTVANLDALRGDMCGDWIPDLLGSSEDIPLELSYEEELILYYYGSNLLAFENMLKNRRIRRMQDSQWETNQALAELRSSEELSAEKLKTARANLKKCKLELKKARTENKALKNGAGEKRSIVSKIKRKLG